MSKVHMVDRPADVDASTDVERIHADHVTTKRLGHWTRAGRYEIRARGGSVVLDLRSPQLPNEVEIRLRLDRAVVKLLLPDEATVEHWDLAWTGRGKVKDAQAAAPSEQRHEEQPREADKVGQEQQPTGGVTRVRLVGSADGGEVRINRGGIAMLAAMCSREYVEDLRQARKTGTYPTIDDPTRPPKAAA
jgi:hypothetical protein